jgi:uncharacterized protein YdeI (YjbR/CyaY-like superfamily)
MASLMAKALPENAFCAQNIAQWRNWLIKNHRQTEGIWLVTYKKSNPDYYLSYYDIVQQALCFGWIDSKPNKLDEQRTMLWLAPRKARTGWSRLNKEHIEKMLASGQMAQAGLAKIEAAKKDGSWFLLDAVEALVMPDDLKKALMQYPKASTHFDAFPRSAKRGILEWIQNAKTESTRQKRIATTAELAEQNTRANQWRPK